MIRGIVTGLEDHGSIVIMFVEDRDGADNPVYFDRRAFHHVVAEIGYGSSENLLGREVEVRGDSGGQVVEFDPDPEDADAEQDQVTA